MAQVATGQLATAPTGPPSMTYEEFLKWVDEETHAEWADGKVVFMSPVTDYHEQLVGWLKSLLHLYADITDGGEVFGDPFQMKTGADLPGRAPDVVFVAREHLHWVTRFFLDGPADVVIEVISKDSRHRDRHDKYREYEAGGVREYWLIDPDRERAEFFRLGANGRFAAVALEDGVFRSEAMPGVWLKLAWFWEDPLPRLLDVLREWRLI